MSNLGDKSRTSQRQRRLSRSSKYLDCVTPYSYRGFYSRKYEHDFYARKKYLHHVQTKVSFQLTDSCRMKRYAGTLTNTPRPWPRRSKNGKSKMLGQSSQSWQAICITLHQQKQYQVSTTLHIQTSNLKHSMSISKPI